MTLRRIRARTVALLGGLISFVALLAACTTTVAQPAVTTTTLPPAGVHTDYLFDCQAAGSVQVDVAGGITVDAPATVDQGDNFTIEYVIDPISIPSYSAPATISSVGGWNFGFTVPTNASFVDATVSGGQGYSGTATVAESGGHIQFAISGNAPANGTVDYPIISVTLTATGLSGADVESSIGGTSYADPGLSFVSVTNFGSIATACYPYAPAPVFSTTEIVGGPAGALEVGTCYSMTDLGQSFQYLGPANVLGNSLHYNDATGCSTTPVDNSQSSVLSGQVDQAGAEATCQALLPGGFVSSLSILEPINPLLNSADYWGCFVL